MNEKHKQEVDELLSLYIDEQASERQRTELKRLIRHDKTIAERLKSMKRQRQILNALPVEAAPASMVDDVRAALERKLILDDFSNGGETASGTSHLFARRMLSNAAMILVPMGLLGLVVYHIVKPPVAPPVPYVKTGDVLSGQENDVDKTAVTPMLAQVRMPFKGTLTFTTDQPMTVGNFVEKMIFDTGIFDNTVPNRTTDVTRYNITASPEQTVRLLDSLEGVWPRCETVVLNVQDDTRDIEIVNARLEQIKVLVTEDSIDMYNRLAARYASANLKKEATVAVADENNEDAFDPLRRPIMTGRNELPANTGKESDTTIELKIYIKRAMD